MAWSEWKNVGVGKTEITLQAGYSYTNSLVGSLTNVTVPNLGWTKLRCINPQNVQYINLNGNRIMYEEQDISAMETLVLGLQAINNNPGITAYATFVLE